MPDIPIIVLASRNRKKVGEIELLLKPYGISVQSVQDFPQAQEVIEDGNSFAANAGKKATETALATGHWAIGEDSGLCVDALNGAPGIYSARFSGPEATDAKNNQLLQEKLAGIPEQKRTAYYVCHIALSDPTGTVRLNVERYCRGRIVSEPRGENGFGYDPYFLVVEYNKTFGELSATVKKCLSHRARAFNEFLPRLQAILE